MRMVSSEALPTQDVRPSEAIADALLDLGKQRLRVRIVLAACVFSALAVGVLFGASKSMPGGIETGLWIVLVLWLVFVRVALLPGMSPENGLLAPEREALQQARLAAHTASLAREDALWDTLKDLNNESALASSTEPSPS